MQPNKDDIPFEIGKSEFDISTFLEIYWQKNPLYIPGGAALLLNKTYGKSYFSKWRKALLSSSPMQITESAKNGIFIRQVDTVDDELRKIADRIKIDTRSKEVWWDAKTSNPNSDISCRFDDSDTFILQQNGVRTLRVHEPSVIPQSVVRQKLMNRSEISTFYMPDDYDEFSLNPGDMLYIPTLWLIQDISKDKYSSLSLVCNQTNLWREFTTLITDWAFRDPIWWKPLPVTKSGFKLKINKLVSDTVLSLEIPELQKQLSSQIADKKHYRDNREEIVRLQQKLDMQRAFDLLSAPIQPLPNLNQCIVPIAKGEQFNIVRKHLFKLYLRRFLQIIGKNLDSLSKYDAGQNILIWSKILLDLPNDILVNAILNPELISWIHRSFEALSFNYVGRIAEVSEQLGLILLPYAIQGRISTDKALPYISCNPKYSVPLPLFAKQISHPCKQLQNLQLTLSNGNLAFYLGKQKISEFAYNDLQNAIIKQNSNLRGMPTVNEGRIPVVLKHSWYDQFLPSPKHSGLSDSYSDIPAKELIFWVQGIDDSLKHLHNLWHPYYLEFNSDISRLMPLRSKGLSPHNESISAFRGLIRTAMRPPLLLAQSLVHECAHNRLNSILDLCTLYRNSDSEEFTSPFVNKSRPLKGIFHGAYAFISDVYFTNLFHNKGYSIQEFDAEIYLIKKKKEIETALSIIAENGQLTVHGKELLDGLINVLNEIR